MSMHFSQIAQAMGIQEYPEALNAVYDTSEKPNVCDEALLAQLQEEFQSFGCYYDAVVEGARCLSRDPVALAWAQTVSAYIRHADLLQMRQIPCPAFDGTPARDMLPLLTLLPLIPVSIGEYRRRGFPEEIVRKCASAYVSSIQGCYARTGRVGINQMYYNWLCVYAKAQIFYTEGFGFELKKFPQCVACLRNRETGAHVLLQVYPHIHRSGLVLGTVGCEDEAGAFEASLQETEDAFYGYPVENCRIVNRVDRYPKSQWECILHPDDDVLSLHIPAGTDLTPEKVHAAIAAGRALASKCYPERSLKVLICVSWLLNPLNEEILGSDSKISTFAGMFLRYPVLSAGNAGFSFIFVGQFPDYQSLPEDTRLQRGIKKHLLEGGHLLHYGGVLV